MTDDDLTAVLRATHDSTDNRPPHRQPSVLRLLLHEHLLSQSDAAKALRETFGGDVSKSMISRAKDDHDIRDAITDGPFADVFEGGQTEPAQPPAFFLDRSDATPIHPFDTKGYERGDFEEGGAPRNAELSTTTHFPSSDDIRTPASPSDTTNPDAHSGTGVQKGQSDPTPSDWRRQKSDRDELLVAPPWAARGDSPLAAKYHACACGTCPERHYLDGDGGAVDCPRAVPVTVAGARRIYQHTEGAGFADDVTGNAVSRGRRQYARLMKADSAALRASDTDAITFVGGRHNDDDTTTVLLSLRVAPTDDEDRLVTPFTLVQDTKDAWAEARDRLPRDVGEGLISYFWTLAGTDEWATPHVHCYCWYHDPDDAVTRAEFTDTVATFVEASTFAPADAHVADGHPTPVGSDGAFRAGADGVTDAVLKEGSVRVEHEPLRVDPERLRTRIGDGPFDDVLDRRVGPRRVTNGSDAQTRGAVYVGTQLPDLALLGAESDAETEAAAFLDAHADGRHTTHGGGQFYQLAEVLDALTEYESEAPMK